MTGCPEFEQLERLLAGALTAAEHDRVESHIEECPACQQRLAQFTDHLAPAVVPRPSGAAEPRHRPDTKFRRRLKEVLFPVERQVFDRAEAPVDTADAHTSAPAAAPPIVPTDEIVDELGRSGGVVYTANRYEILGELGRGGMGVVYRALDGRTGRVVALKTMQRRDGTSLEFFKREFRHLQELSHPNLVQLFELESDGREWLLTMELVEGVDFLSHVRPGVGPSGSAAAASPASASLPVLDEGRLRESLGQLAEGIATLHAHRRVHRDLKPQNVRVSPEGRVVVLDFGLATVLGPTGEHVHTGHLLLGTLPYMAPEQGDDPPVSSPASDWYSVGVMLYQALTGRLPFSGSALQMMRDKLSHAPPSPRELCPDVPDDLNDLCLALLRPLPQDRPNGTTVLESLARLPAPSAGASIDEAPLLGRERHLRVLEEAFAASRERRAIVVAVHGPSGVGKSALVRHFLERRRGRGAVVLAGRCYERESVPYKALDPLVDELARYLRCLPHHEVEARLPRDMGPLTRVFPVLGCVTAVAEAAVRSSSPPDLHEARRRAFAGLRELLARVGDRQPLVLHIDDLQWGDIESARLLAELLQPPNPPPLLLLISYRSEDADSPCLRVLAEALGQSGFVDRRDLAVAPLTETETHELALLFLGAGAVADAAGIARESGGNPFFLIELVQEIQSGAAHAGCAPAIGAITLEGLIRARVARLPAAAQRLLEVIAVSGRPLGEAQAWGAADAGAEARTLVARLEGARLLRGTGSAKESKLETYHDRIREAILAHLAPGSRVDCHRRIARVLEEWGQADPEFLAVHWAGAQELETSGRFYAIAAARAADVLAFDRAATLYRLALELLPNEEEQKSRLRAKLGDALANAGRGAEAAREYLAAAAESGPSLALELQGRAALQFLISGHVDEGLGSLRTVLGAVRLKLPPTPRRALLSLLTRRAQLWLRGTWFKEREESQVSRVDLSRIDVCWSVAVGLSMIDIIRGADFQTRGLLLALRAGEPYRIARALAMEAAHVATAGGVAAHRTAKLLKAAEELARKADKPHAIGLVALVGGGAAYLEGRYRDCLALSERAERLFREACTGVTWELDTAQAFALYALCYLGEMAELSRRLPLVYQQAQKRGDLYALANWGTFVRPLVRMAADDTEGARRELEAFTGQWSRQGFHVQHANRLFRQGELALYQGDGAAAWRHATELSSGLARSLMARVQHLRIDTRHLHARSALAAAAHGANPTPLLRAAERDAGRLEREKRTYAGARARLIRAALAAARGDTSGAMALLEGAAAGFDVADMQLYAAAARRRLGELTGGDEGRALVAQADVWMTGQQIRNPARMTDMLAPGFVH